MQCKQGAKRKSHNKTQRARYDKQPLIS